MFAHSFLVALLATVPSLTSASFSPNFPAPILHRAPVIVTTTLSPHKGLFHRTVAPSTTTSSTSTTAATTVAKSPTISISSLSTSIPSCPAGTLAQQTAADGTLWMVCDDSYIVSETIGTLVPGHDVEACYTSCNARSDCVSFTYDLVHYECLFKSTNDISPYDGPNFNGDSSIVFVRLPNAVNANSASVISTIATVSTITSTTSSTTSPVTSTSSVTSTTLSTSTRKASTTNSSPSSVCADGRPPKSTKTVSNGDKYAVCKGNDFYGGDMGILLTLHTLRDCMEACTSQFGCIGAAFIPGNCWLKNVIKPASARDGEDAFYKISSGTPVAIDPSTKSQTTPCLKVTTGYMCPSDEVYYRRDKTMCNLPKDDAAAVCNPK